MFKNQFKGKNNMNNILKRLIFIIYGNKININNKEKNIQDLTQINKDKDEAVTLLQSQRQDLENKLKEIESDIDIEVGKGNDRPSSGILKDTFRKLGVMK